MRSSGLLLATIVALATTQAHAQQRTITIELTPTIRTQLAIWIESEDGTLFQTLRLTDSVAFRGIGNRPGAMQMDSGYRWPYGRREGVLPIWAHRRYDATGVAWRRVIFADRPEGYASRAGDEDYNTPDPFYCLSFSGHETVDAVSCASVFRSNKGRFITDADLGVSYGEPFEDAPGVAHVRVLSAESLYPPRGDYMPIPECPDCRDHHHDHADLAAFHDERLRVMPDLDTVTMATPPRDELFSFTYDVPDAWPDGAYVVYVEASTEFDFADPDWRRDSPRDPHGAWDCYAVGTCGEYGQGYRGQPSVLYAVPIALGDPNGDGDYVASEPVGHGELHGLDGSVTTMSGSGMIDDPTGHPGSGADRLRARDDGVRVQVHVPVIDRCRSTTPPHECGATCTSEAQCGTQLACGPSSTCVGRCTFVVQADAPGALTLTPVDDIHHTHEWAHVTFVAPEVPRGLASYEVRVSEHPITDVASFEAGRPAKAATIEDQAVRVPASGAPGETVTFEIGQLAPTTTFYVGVRAFDHCHAAGQIASAEITTTEIHFTTVSPCFVATAAYGTPLDARIGVLRRFRDRWLMPNELGRALVSAYYEVGPSAAAWIAEDEDRRATTRAILDTLVSLLE